MNLSETDRAELLDLYARYAWAYDGGDPEGYAALFTPDGLFERPGADPVTGPAELAAMVRAAHERRSGYTHLISNILVEPTAEGAVGKAYALVMVMGSDSVSLLTAGRYHDTFVRTAQGWRFTARRFEPATGAALAGAVIAGAG